LSSGTGRHCWSARPASALVSPTGLDRPGADRGVRTHRRARRCRARWLRTGCRTRRRPALPWPLVGLAPAGGNGESALSAEIGSAGPAEIIVTGPVRHSLWSLRVPAEIRAFRGQRLRERVLLLLPVGAPAAGRDPGSRGNRFGAAGGHGGFDERGGLHARGSRRPPRGGGTRSDTVAGSPASAIDCATACRERLNAARADDGARSSSASSSARTKTSPCAFITTSERRACTTCLPCQVRTSPSLRGVFGLGWLLRLPRVARELVAIGGIGVYVLAVGWQPSVVRAGVAGCLASAAWLSARPRDRWHFLAVGALVLLAWAPSSVLEPGFQLSFAAVAAIFAVLPRTRSWLDGYPIPMRLGDVLAVALVCGVVTAPIVLADSGVAPVTRSLQMHWRSLRCRCSGSACSLRSRSRSCGCRFCVARRLRADRAARARLAPWCSSRTARRARRTPARRHGMGSYDTTVPVTHRAAARTLLSRAAAPREILASLGTR
jgi:ComEC/Rec2-related protein